MANIKSAEKRNRQNTVRRERNRAARSTMRTAVKNVRKSVEAGEVEAAKALLPDAVKTIDVTAQKGVIHRNTAARYKSRLVSAVQGAAEKPES